MLAEPFAYSFNIFNLSDFDLQQLLLYFCALDL